MASGKIWIPSETGTLRSAVVSGLPSVEQELVQLYPTGKSLFLESMDVLRARYELGEFTSLLRRNGVEVFVMKEELSKAMGRSTYSNSDILMGLFRSAYDIAYSQGITMPKDLKERIAFHLELDSAIYGKNEAYALAKALSIDNGYPLGNIIYARDQTNVVMGHRIVSSMAYPIRRPEVELYEKVYASILGPHPTITIPKGEIFEGGSLLVYNSTVFIDVDPRTTEGAAIHIFKQLAKSYPDLKFVIVKNGSRNETFAQRQSSMHLDMYAMPIREGYIAICEEEAAKRQVIMVEVKSGRARKVPTGKSLMQYLQDEGNHIVVVSKADQSNFGTNFVVGVGPLKAAVMSISARSDTTEAIKAHGVSILPTPVDAITNGFGGTHCSLSALVRE